MEEFLAGIWAIIASFLIIVGVCMYYEPEAFPLRPEVNRFMEVSK